MHDHRTDSGTRDDGTAVPSACTSCGRHPATDEADTCLVCRTRFFIYNAQLTGISRRIAAVIQEGRALGLDDQSITWAVEDAGKVDPGDASSDASLFPRAAALVTEADELRYEAHGDDDLDDDARRARHVRADELVIAAGQLVEMGDVRSAAGSDGVALLPEVAGDEARVTS